MNPLAILALLSNLYEQLQAAQERAAAAEARAAELLAAQPSEGSPK